LLSTFIKVMKYLSLPVILLLTFGFTACPLKEKKESPTWVVYQNNAQTALEALKSLQEQEFAATDDIESYKKTLQETAIKVENFLQNNKSEPPRKSHTEIKDALEDFSIVVELMERKKSSVGNNFFNNKLFANTDSKLFERVKQRYKLGPELQTASHTYYYIDPILHEALRSANNHIERATRRLKDEVTAEAKAAREAKKEALKNLQDMPTATPSPDATPSSLDPSTRLKNTTK